MKWYAVSPRMGNMKDSFETTKVDLSGFDPHRLLLGQRIADWPSKVVFYQDEEESWSRVDDVLMNSYVDSRTFRSYIFPVYSSRLRGAIEEAGISDFQFLPCEVRDFAGNEVAHGYSIANVLTIKDALDATASKVHYFDQTLPRLDVLGNIICIYSAALRASEIGDCHAFRIPNEPRELFVSGFFRRKYHKLKATGISFRDALLVN